MYQLIRENAGPGHIDLALKVFDQVHKSSKLAPEHQRKQTQVDKNEDMFLVLIDITELLVNWSEELRRLKAHNLLLESVTVPTSKWDYMLHAENTLGPVKLIARKMKTSHPFFIGANAFSKLHTNLKADNGDFRQSALMLVLKIWKANLPSSRTYWPQNVSIMLNGVTLSTRMVRK
jgi:hypothetical protein